MECLWCGHRKDLFEHFTKFGFCHRCDALVRDQIKDSLFHLSSAADQCDARFIRHRVGSVSEPTDQELLLRLDEALGIADDLEALRDRAPFFKTSLDDLRASLLRCRAVLPGAPALPAPPPCCALPGEAPEAFQRREAFRALLASLEYVPIVPGERPKQPKRWEPLPLRRLTCAQVATGSDPDKLGSFVALDVKTTSSAPRRAQIVGISAVRFEAFVPCSVFTTLLIPAQPISPRAALQCGVDNEMVRGMPLMDEILPALREFLGDARLVGYNLAAELRLLSVYGIKPPEAPRSLYDTLLLARGFLSAPDKLLPGDGVRGFDVPDYALPTLCDHYAVFYEDRYRPGADCLSIGLLFAALVRSRTGNSGGKTGQAAQSETDADNAAGKAGPEKAEI